MICGFLDTNGRYYPCSRWEHISKAAEIVDQLQGKLRKSGRYELAEDVLLYNGWICIRGSDVYKAIYDYEGKILFITEAQQNFFTDHKMELNPAQLADIESLLKDFGKLYKWHKGETEHE